MNFDRIAPFYGWMELFVAGPCLQRARLACLDEIESPQDVVIVGEGRGHFLEVLANRFPEARITVIDGSSAMLEAASKRVAGNRNITFVHALLEDWVPDGTCDLIVTHFMLDCLDEAGVKAAVAKLAGASSAEADWLIADFQVTGWRSRAIVKLLYGFFRIVTRIPADRLHDPSADLEACGFRRAASKSLEWGLLKSERWRKTLDGSGLGK